MADDVDARAERAADAARSAVKREHRASGSLLPMLVMILAVLSLAVLVITDKDAAQPTQPRVEAPTTSQGTTPGN